MQVDNYRTRLKQADDTEIPDLGSGQKVMAGGEFPLTVTRREVSVAGDGEQIDHRA
jgi:hypothetical protein